MTIERTPEAQRGFEGMTTKITMADTPSRLAGTECEALFCELTKGHDGAHMSHRAQEVYDQLHPPKNGAAMDPFQDDTPINQTCNTENPEACEACD